MSDFDYNALISEANILIETVTELTDSAERSLAVIKLTLNPGVGNAVLDVEAAKLPIFQIITARAKALSISAKQAFASDLCAQKSACACMWPVTVEYLLDKCQKDSDVTGAQHHAMASASKTLRDLSRALIDMDNEASSLLFRAYRDVRVLPDNLALHYAAKNLSNMTVVCIDLPGLYEALCRRFNVEQTVKGHDMFVEALSDALGGDDLLMSWSARLSVNGVPAVYTAPEIAAAGLKHWELKETIFYALGAPESVKADEIVDYCISLITVPDIAELA